MTAVLTVTAASTIDQALTGKVFVNNDNITFDGYEYVEIGRFVYPVAKDPKIGAGDIGMNGIMRREQDVKLGDAITVKAYSPEAGPGGACVRAISVNIKRYSNLQGKFAQGYPERYFAEKFGGRIITVGQTFVTKPLEDDSIVAHYTVVSMNWVLYRGQGIAFELDNGGTRGICPSDPAKITVVKLE